MSSYTAPVLDTRTPSVMPRAIAGNEYSVYTSEASGKR